jgi:negative regulator of sigma E activity
MNGSPATPILTCLRLLKALSLSRRGKMKAAQSLLVAEETAPENLIELHALAALVTTEGDYPRALRLWRLLLDHDPRHAEAKRMIASIELWTSRPPWVRYVPAGAVALIVVIVVAVLVFSGGSHPPAARTAPPPPAALAPAGPRPASAPPQTITVPGVTKRKTGQ